MHQDLLKNKNVDEEKVLESFNKKTKIPMVLNTSFNLAGDPIVETINDAINSLRKSSIEYLYLPDINKILYVPNQ